MFDDLDHADDVEAGVGHLGEFGEIEDAKAVVFLQQVGKRAHVVSGHSHRLRVKLTALAQKFQEPTSATTEVKPLDGRGWGMEGEELARDSRQVVEFQNAFGPAPVAVF